ncbi:hypothetical protein EXD82_02480 [Peptacetobacter hominis]|uniref:Cell shape-determining protein n=1 Tax=Peptacetobacter hominis TaxID=2743610 RepID=A0A544QX61_9FIRM|nr:hypothetical protein [Peptacetobacter hominis]TQQ85282.1 hypothetical protein EXD82_02480 [Peptacetobacter hominis]
MKNIKGYIAAFVITAVYAFIKLPVLRPDFTSLYYVAIIFFVLAGILNLLLKKEEDVVVVMKKRIGIEFKIAARIAVFAVIIPALISTPIFRDKSYRNLIGKVEESEFTEDISPVSVDDIRIVDEDMAMKLGDKKLGEVPAIGSVSKLGDFHIQKVDGELYWVAPLVHRDVIKWITNLSGTNGYVMVSAKDPQDVKLVQNIDGKQIKIKYQPEAYFLQDLHRHAYINGVVSNGMTDFTMEVDDNGRPYWIISLYDHKVGFGGSDVTGTAIVDAQTGETKVYSIKNTPEWVDRIQPSDFVISQINNWGLYVNGFINSIISEKGVLVATEGTSLVYGDDDRSYWYTGITSAGGDESTIGFMLVDSRTKEAKLYKQPGATETAAMKSAEGSVQEKNYEATFPVMYNIYGKPTYVSSLKDKAGLVKKVVFVSVEDYNIVGVGDNKNDAIKSYKEALESGGSEISSEAAIDDIEKEGKVLRIARDVKSGNTYYYMTIEGIENSIFYCTSKVSPEVTLTKEGDTVKIRYSKSEKGNIEIDEFDNYSIGVVQK